MSRSYWPTLASSSGLFLAALLGLFPGAARAGDGPDTDAWKVVFSDKFDGTELGERWKTVFGHWTIEDGALKGLLRKKDLAGYDYHDADIALKGTEIPATVEIRYETWSPDAVGSEAKFLTQASDAGIVLACMGVAHPAYGSKGTFAFVFKNMSYRLVGMARGAQFAPKDHHKVRILREKDQATFFLDGKKVLTADVSDAKEFRDLNLHLVGTWGKEGSVVYFDNLEIRVPANP